MKRSIKLRSADEIARCREAGQRAAAVLAMITPHVRAGVSTEELDDRCREYIVRELRCTPANIGYRGFPKTLCSSINHVVCHGIPAKRDVLREGDIVNLDVAVIHEGWYGDTSRMYTVGAIGPRARKVVDVAYAAMRAGILAVKPGGTLGDVGHAIEQAARQARCTVVRDYGGHGIGTVYHDLPDVLNFGRPGQGQRLVPGMVFTVEPMVNLGSAETRELDDGWTVITADRSLSAQWEHMVAVTETGFEVLTPWPEGTGSYPAIG